LHNSKLTFHNFMLTYRGSTQLLVNFQHSSLCSVMRAPWLQLGGKCVFAQPFRRSATMKRRLAQTIKQHVPRDVLRQVRRILDAGDDGDDDSDAAEAGEEWTEQCESPNIFTPHGPLIAELDIPLDGGGVYKWNYLNPFALLYPGGAIGAACDRPP
jgi:hypothetical protein